MLDHDAAHRAFRGRLLDLSVAQTTAFARASTATYQDEDGIVQTAAVDELRDGHYVDGEATTLYEAAATNVCLQSEAFGTTWAVAGSSVSSNADTAPDGTVTADRLTEDTSLATSHVVQQSLMLTADVNVAFSVYAKKGVGRDWILVRMDGGGSANRFASSFNLATGAIGTSQQAGTATFTSADIVALASGWYRCAIVGFVGGGDASVRAQVFIAEADSDATFDGDGASYISLWGAQVEVASSAATSYIPTTTASATRAADSDPLIAAVAKGYTRTTGSFITDGFLPGTEVTPAGFTTNTPGIVSQVEALTLSIEGGRTPQAAVAGRTLSVGLPEQRAWENVRLPDGFPIARRPYIDEDYIPATSEMVGAPYDGSDIEETGLYVVNWHGLPGYDVMAIRKCTGAILALFAPGTSLTVGSGSVRVEGSPVGPTVTGIERDGDGWMVCSVEIPWLARTANAVAA